ncbi:hypothetical protein DCC62_02420 [candidate division KSB1 bacterium]|nr:MAG: hypothetical protein DCC62_02420 [candidate division KSB1 bacterium]
MMSRSNFVHNILLPALPVLVLLGLALPNLRLPGLQYDELYYVPPAVRLLYGELGGEPIAIDPSTINLWGRPFPLMFNYYTSFLRTYLALPVFAVCGVTPESVRGISLALAGGALIFGFFFLRRLFRDYRPAFLTCLLLACDPSFVLYSRQDYAAIGTMMLLKMGGFWALLKWWQDKKNLYLYLGLFLLGLGISDRASFLWIVFALAPAVALVKWREAFAGMAALWRDKASFFKAMAAAVAGASIFLAFNLATGGGTFSPMAQNFGKTELGGVNNLQFFDNFWLRCQMLTDLLGGHYLPQSYDSNGAYQTMAWHWGPSPLAWLIPATFIGVVLQQIRRKLKKQTADAALAFLLALSFLIFVQTCFTPTKLSGQQLLLLYPFLHALAAAALVNMYDFFSSNTRTKRVAGRFGTVLLRMKTAIAVVGVAIVLLLSAWPVFTYHRALLTTGGKGVWSDAIYTMADFLREHPGKTVVCMDWGFNQNLLSLSAGKIKTERNYYAHRRMPLEQLAAHFDEQHWFLFHAPQYTLQAWPREDFNEALRLHASAVDTVKKFFQRNGEEVAYLLQISSGAGR